MTLKPQVLGVGLKSCLPTELPPQAQEEEFLRKEKKYFDNFNLEFFLLKPNSGPCNQDILILCLGCYL